MIELASAASFDKINVAGLLTLAGSINVTTIGGYVATNGTTIDFLDWGTLNATGFNLANLNLTGATTEPGTNWDTSSFLTNGSITVVPEPSTYAMMIVGAGMLFVMLRLRRRSS